MSVWRREAGEGGKSLLVPSLLKSQKTCNPHRELKAWRTDGLTLPKAVLLYLLARKTQGSGLKKSLPSLPQKISRSKIHWPQSKKMKLAVKTNKGSGKHYKQQRSANL